MTKPKSDSPRRGRGLVYTIALIVGLGAIVAPAAVYLFGVTLIAPYEGEGGALGFLGTVYGDALAGSSAAWALLLSPAAFVFVWWAAFRLLRATRSQPGAPD